MSSLKLLTHLHVACRLPLAACRSMPQPVCSRRQAACGKPHAPRHSALNPTEDSPKCGTLFQQQVCVSVCVEMCVSVFECVCLCVCAWVCVSIMTNLCVTLARLFTIRVVPFSALTHFAEEHSAMLSSPSLPRSLAPCLSLSLELGIERGFTVYIDKASSF